MNHHGARGRRLRKPLELLHPLVVVADQSADRHPRDIGAGVGKPGAAAPQLG